MAIGTVKWFNEAKGFGFISQQGGEDVLMSMFRRVMAATDQGDAAAVRVAAEHAFRVLFLLSAGVSLIAPFFVMRLQEKTLRGSPTAAAAAATAE
mgnify:CR=1 FL=1